MTQKYNNPRIIQIEHTIIILSILWIILNMRRVKY